MSSNWPTQRDRAPAMVMLPALQSLLRYLHAAGHIPFLLAGAVPRRLPIVMTVKHSAIMMLPGSYIFVVHAQILQAIDTSDHGMY
jgi:hypothetical protein